MFDLYAASKSVYWGAFAVRPAYDIFQTPQFLNGDISDARAEHFCDSGHIAQRIARS
ncbi:MAG: hypothetical protein ACK4HW_05005 [Roseinatronobacter sp.]